MLWLMMLATALETLGHAPSRIAAMLWFVSNAADTASPTASESHCSEKNMLKG